jgi:Holliday junction resolvase RusA-like endonuclease
VITIEVRGLPAPQGSKRHVGRGIMVESSKAVGPWREAVRAETQRVLAFSAISGGGFQSAVHVDITFYLTRPRGHYGTGRNAERLRDSAPLWPSGRPDVDKLARSVLDGLTAGGAWRDDAQVAVLIVRKIYGWQPGCRIELRDLEDS